VTCHDGKTLADLLSYNGAYNSDNPAEESGADARDGSDNHGVEGPSSDPAVTAARGRDSRNILLTLLLAQGMPMILGGDERGRTQRGNTNAYCQDNPISWYHWDESTSANALTAFTQAAIALRRAHPALRRQAFLSGRGTPLPDITWFGPDGGPPDWSDAEQRCLGYLLSGQSVGTVAPDGARVENDDILVIINGSAHEMRVLPPVRSSAGYTTLLTTDNALGTPPAGPMEPGSCFVMPPRTVIVATSPTGPAGEVAERRPLTKG
jgi:isoamylase